MTWPKHKNPTTKARSAVAPYNFVPLPENILTMEDQLPDQDEYHTKRRTGYIECELTTESPLYIRCPLTQEEFERREEEEDQKKDFREKVRNTPGFFYTKERNQPVIPGSSLRGMLRELVEIVSYGKMPEINKQEIFYRWIADTGLRDQYHDAVEDVKAGYVRGSSERGFQIVPATDVNGSTFFEVREWVLQRKKISFTPLWSKNYTVQYVHCYFKASEGGKDCVTEVASQAADGFLKGVLVCTGPVGNKKKTHWIVTEINEGEMKLEIPEHLVKDYCSALTDFQKNKENCFSEKYGALIENRPIFYLERDGKVTAFGHTRNFRLPAGFGRAPRATSPLDFLPKELRCNSKVDLADAIFGYTKQDEPKDETPRARAGRVFVTDAHLVQNPTNALSKEIVTPEILSGPKPTCFQHYLVQTEPDSPEELKHYGSPTPEETVIRGHKLYWHKGCVTLEDIKEKKEVKQGDTQHTKFKPVNPGIRFSFRIHFENLSDVELGALWWALTLPGEQGKEYRHKLGMAKPLGMGAVKLEPTLHLTDRAERYRRLFGGDGHWETGETVEDVSQQALKEFEKHVLSVAATEGEQQLSQVERIQMLLKMLEWPGPDRALTRYLKIPNPSNPRERVNEYGDRPVLPDPLNLDIRQLPEQVPPQRATEPVLPPERPLTEEEPTAVIKAGDKLWARVVANDRRNVTVRLCDYPHQEITFSWLYCPHQPGKRTKVKVQTVTQDGRVTKVVPG